MGKYNNKDIATMLSFSLKEEQINKLESDNCDPETSAYYYFYGKAEAYHEIVHRLSEMKKNL